MMAIERIRYARSLEDRENQDGWSQDIFLMIGISSGQTTRNCSDLDSRSPSQILTNPSLQT